MYRVLLRTDFHSNNFLSCGGIWNVSSSSAPSKSQFSTDRGQWKSNWNDKPHLREKQAQVNLETRELVLNLSHNSKHEPLERPKVFVKDLPIGVTHSDVYDTFAKYGTVEFIKVNIDAAVGSVN